ncbi:MAG TPA: hypothetical protein VNK41_07415 [Vicinamibacterales bacterium]|nr:hypothetical protein [Vicinamibacterales bacterium]
MLAHMHPNGRSFSCEDFAFFNEFNVQYGKEGEPGLSTIEIYISEAAASEFFDQASRPKEQRWYDAEHGIDVPAAAADRQAWLAGQLGLRQN